MTAANGGLKSEGGPGRVRRASQLFALSLDNRSGIIAWGLSNFVRLERTSYWNIVKRWQILSLPPCGDCECEHVVLGRTNLRSHGGRRGAGGGRGRTAASHWALATCSEMETVFEARRTNHHSAPVAVGDSGKEEIMTRQHRLSVSVWLITASRRRRE